MKLNSGKNNTLWKKWYVLIPWLALPFLGIGFYFLSIYKQPFLLAAQDYKADSLMVFTDKADNGNSECHLIEGAGFSYRYTIKKGSDYQYAGVWFKSGDSTWFDLADYDYLKIKVKMSSAKWITISLGTHVPGLSVDSNVITHKYLNHVLSAGTQAEERILPIKDFTTPLWWYHLNGKKESEVGEADLSKVKYITFVHTPNNDIGVENRVDIPEAGFYVDYVPFYYQSATGLVIYFIVSFWVVYVINRRTLKRSLHFSYEKVESRNHLDREEAIIFDFLNVHFANTELTVTDVQTGTGISERRISAVIRSKSGLNFKQYLHQIRIARAKKLLAEGELPVVDIAYRCGYSSASHFNRVFKSVENCSPNDFRKQQQPSVINA